MCLGATGLTSRKAIACKARHHRVQEHRNLNYIACNLQENVICVFFKKAVAIFVCLHYNVG